MKRQACPEGCVSVCVAVMPKNEDYIAGLLTPVSLVQREAEPLNLEKQSRRPAAFRPASRAPLFIGTPGFLGELLERRGFPRNT